MLGGKGSGVDVKGGVVEDVTLVLLLVSEGSDMVRNEESGMG